MLPYAALYIAMYAALDMAMMYCGPDERGVHLSPLLFGFVFIHNVFINDFKNSPPLPHRFRLALS